MFPENGKGVEVENDMKNWHSDKNGDLGEGKIELHYK